jgi:hypothetical protein
VRNLLASICSIPVAGQQGQQLNEMTGQYLCHHTARRATLSSPIKLPGDSLGRVLCTGSRGNTSDQTLVVKPASSGLHRPTELEVLDVTNKTTASFRDYGEQRLARSPTRSRCPPITARHCVVACVTDSRMRERGWFGSAALELRDICHQA